MAESLRQFAIIGSEIARNEMRHHATDCIACARAIWPKKTAANWAAESGVQERMAAYWLAGSHPIADSGRIAIALRILSRA